MTTRQKIFTLLGLSLAWTLADLPARAQAQSDTPAAIIEDIKATGVNYGILDVLSEGTTIKLGAEGTLRVAYLRSCIVEDVKGGTVIVGESQSRVEGGVIQSQETVNCDGGGIVPTERQAQDVAGVVFRAPDVDYDKPIVLVYATAPILAFATPAKEVKVERVDSDQAETYDFPVNGNHIDLKDRGVALSPGGLYRATTEHGKVLFRISRKATDAKVAAVSRLVRF